MKEKKNKLLVFFVVILSLLVLILGGYLAYEKFFVKSNDEIIGNGAVKDDGGILTLANELLTKYDYPENLNEDTKMFVALRNEKGIYIDSVDCKTLYSDITPMYGEYYVKLDASNGRVSEGVCGQTAMRYSYLSVNEVYKKLFGTDMPKRDLIYSDGISYNIYDYKEDSFYELGFNGGGVVLDRTVIGIKDAKIDGDKLIVNVGSVVLSPDADESFGLDFEIYVVSSDKSIKYAKDKVDGSMFKSVKKILLIIIMI